MDKLFELFLKETNTSFIHYIYTEINWKSRMIGLTGSRGIEKTTHILIHSPFDDRNVFMEMRKLDIFKRLDDQSHSDEIVPELIAPFIFYGLVLNLSGDSHKPGSYEHNRMDRHHK